MFAKRLTDPGPVQDVDQRSQTFTKAVEMSRLYSRRARTIVLRCEASPAPNHTCHHAPQHANHHVPYPPLARSAILRAGISVKCQARDQPEHGNFNNVPQ